MHRKQPLSILDLAAIFEVETLTIKRDLRDLRSEGIEIHSKKNEGVTLSGVIPPQALAGLILHYVALSDSAYLIDKAAALLISKLNSQALSFIVTAQMCIDKHERAVIDYEKDSTLVTGRVIEPVLIFQNDGNLRIFAQNGDGFKQYLFDKIKRIVRAGSNFEPVPLDDISAQFSHSWKSWTGSKRIPVKLKFCGQWARRLKIRTFLPGQKITGLDDGSAIFEAEVNHLSEIASWIVSRGEDVIVMEPEELKETVIRLAKGALKNYSELL